MLVSMFPFFFPPLVFGAQFEHQLQGAISRTQDSLLQLYPTLESAYQAYFQAPDHLKSDYKRYLENRWPTSADFMYSPRLRFLNQLLLAGEKRVEMYKHLSGFPEITRCLLRTGNFERICLSSELLEEIEFELLEPYLREGRISLKLKNYLIELACMIQRKHFGLLAKITDYFPPEVSQRSPLFMHILKSNRTDVDWNGPVCYLAVHTLLMALQNPGLYTGRVHLADTKDCMSTGCRGVLARSTAAPSLTAVAIGVLIRSRPKDIDVDALCD